MPVPPLPFNTDFFGFVLGLLAFVVVLGCANLAAFYLLRAAYSRSLSVDARKIRGVLGMFAGMLGAVVAGLNESAWLFPSAFMGLVCLFYALNAGDDTA
jgi:hypothetical protein